MDTAVKPNDSSMMFREKMPELYNNHLVPLMFEAPAEHVADLVKATQPKSILELAAGTGVVTRAMARKLPEQVKITSTDKSEDMIKVAQSKMEGASNVTFQPADATKLPFDDAQFDLVVCQFGMSFFPDKLASLKETFRVLKPGGRCIYLIWDNWAEMTESPMVIAGGTIARLLKVDPRSLANAPYYDEDIIRKDFTTAGLTDFQLIHKEFPSTAESAKDAAMATVYASISRHGIEQQNVVTLEQAREAVEEALVDKFGSGRIEGRIKGVLVQARKERSHSGASSMAQSRHSVGSSAAGPSRIPTYLASAPRVSSSTSTHSIRSPRNSSRPRRSNGGPRKSSSAFDDFDAPAYCNDMAAFIAEQLGKKSTFSKHDDYRIADLPNDGWRGTPRKVEATQLADVSVQTALGEENEEIQGSSEGEEGLFIEMGETQDDIDFARTRKTKDAVEAFLRQVQGKEEDGLEEENELEKQAMHLFGAAADDSSKENIAEQEKGTVQPEIAAQIAGMLAEETSGMKKPLIEVVGNSDAEGSDEDEDASDQNEDGEDDEDQEEGSEDDSGSILIVDSEDEASEEELIADGANESIPQSQLVEEDVVSEDELNEDNIEMQASASRRSVAQNSDDDVQSVGQNDAMVQAHDADMYVEEATEAYESDQDNEEMSTYDSYADIYQDEGKRDTRGDDSEDAIELLDSDEEEEGEILLPTQIVMDEAEVIGDSSYENDVVVSANMFELDQTALDASFWTAEPGDATMMETSNTEPDMASQAMVQEAAAEVPGVEVEKMISREASLVPPPAEDIQSNMTSGAQLLSLKNEISTDMPSSSRPESIVVLPGTPQRVVSFEESRMADKGAQVNDARGLMEIKEVVNDAIHNGEGAAAASLRTSLVSDIDSLPNKDGVDVIEEKMASEKASDHVEIELRPEEIAAGPVGEVDADLINDAATSGQSKDVEETVLDEIAMAEIPLADPEAILTEEIDYAKSVLDNTNAEAADELVQGENLEDPNERDVVTPRRSGRARTESRRKRSPSPLIGKMASISGTPHSQEFNTPPLETRPEAKDEKEFHPLTNVDLSSGATNEQQEGDPGEEDHVHPLELGEGETIIDQSDEVIEEHISPPPASPLIIRRSVRSFTPTEENTRLDESTFDSQLDTFDSAYSLNDNAEDVSRVAVAGSIAEEATPRGRRRKREGSSERRSDSPVITKRSLRSATPSSKDPFSYDSFVTSSSGDLASSFDDKNIPLYDDRMDAIEEASMTKSKPKRRKGRPPKVRLSQEVRVEEPAPTITKGSLRSATPRATSETPSDMSLTASGKKKRRSPRKSDPGGDLADFVPEAVEEEEFEEESSLRPSKRVRTREPTEEQQVEGNNLDGVNEDDLLDTSILEAPDSLMDVDEPEEDPMQTIDGSQNVEGQGKKSKKSPRRSGPRKSADPSFRVTKEEQSESENNDDMMGDKKRKRAEQAKAKREADREKRRNEREEKKRAKETDTKEAKEAEREAAGLERKRRISEDAKTFRPDKRADDAETEDEEESRRPMTRRRSRRTASQTPGS